MTTIGAFYRQTLEETGYDIFEEIVSERKELTALVAKLSEVKKFDTTELDKFKVRFEHVTRENNKELLTAAYEEAGRELSSIEELEVDAWKKMWALKRRILEEMASVSVEEFLTKTVKDDAEAGKVILGFISGIQAIHYVIGKWCAEALELRRKWLMIDYEETLLSEKCSFLKAKLEGSVEPDYLNGQVLRDSDL